jgi:T-complex protein 1 subunit theta
MAEEAGYVDCCETVEIGSDRCVVFRQEDTLTKAVTLVLRGATANFLDDVERAVDDGVNAVKLATRDSRYVPGGGAFEIELASRLRDVADKTHGVSALGVKAFAESLEVIPRVLADNAGLDATDVLSQLQAAHAKKVTTACVNVEIDAVDGSTLAGTIGVRDVNELAPYAVYDPLLTKIWALKYASDAALTVLRVDQIIMSKPAGGPKMPKGGNAYDDDDMA